MDITACNYNPEATKQAIASVVPDSVATYSDCFYPYGCNDWCGGDSTGMKIFDCNGECGGLAEMDNCGTCDSDSINDCEKDCADEWGGDAGLDECGVCGGNGIAEGQCDCDGSVLDECGVCGGNNVDMDDCGVCFADNASMDDCGVCDGNNSPNTGTCDCDGTPNGDATYDCDGVCGGSAYWCYGCTDLDAINYNSIATIDDGSCINFNTQIAGCINSLNAGNNVTLQAKAVNNSSVTITISGIMLLNNENQVILLQGLNTALQPNYYVTYNMNLAYPSSGNAFEYISNGYKILWQFDYDGNTYQNTYEINGTIGGC